MRDNLPNLFSNNTTEKNWNERRIQFVEMFEKYVFGMTPKTGFETCASLLYEEPALQGKARREYYRIEVKKEQASASFHMCLILPCVEEKVPVVLMISNHDKCASKASMPDSNAVKKLLEEATPEWLAQIEPITEAQKSNCDKAPELLDIQRDEQNEYWPVNQIIASGRAAAAFYAAEVQPDDRKQFPSEFTALFEDAEAKEKGQYWGTLGVWAFAASRVIDVLCTHKAIDPKRISLAGHSRGAKTALWCAAQDTRVNSVLVNNSGCTGAAISRGKKGENVASINAFFPHWFCSNYAQYAWKENAMPFDQHMLLAAVAPRLCYVTSSTKDMWSDPDAEWQGIQEASKAWKLVGQEELPIQPPAAGHTVCAGNVGYHRREGTHGLTMWDWEQFLNFLDKHKA